MSSDDIAIRVCNLSKSYQIYESPHDRLKQFVLPRLQRATGQEPQQYYRDFRALNDVSFEVRKGETVGIIGRNGSGKSTLLQIICGTLSPTGGTVETRGRIAALLELGSGFNPEFTGRDNVYLNASVLGLSNEEIETRFEDIVAFADIGEFIDQPVKTYSSGMVVRLAFAVAINVDPEILIIDEALSVGDELFQRKCFSRIETIKSTGATILFVSHAVSLIIQFCDSAILLDRGKLLLQGTPRTVTKYYHQLIFSKADEQTEIADSIRKGAFEGNDRFSGKTAVDDAFSDYVDGLASIAPLRYQNRGGKIISFELQDSNSSRVNIVSSGFFGIVKLVVRFDALFHDVIFGFHLKSTSGLEVAGISYPSPQDSLIAVAPNDTLEVFWKVNILLAPGMYFFTCGVRSVSDGGFIDRIVDGDVVKVIDQANSPAFGLFNISDQGQSWIQKSSKQRSE